MLAWTRLTYAKVFCSEGILAARCQWSSTITGLKSSNTFGLVSHAKLMFNSIMKTNVMMLLVFAALPAFAENPYAIESAIYRVEHVRSGSMSTGTGVLVAPDKILTNCHIVRGEGWPRVINRKTDEQFKVTKHYNLGDLDACILVGSFTGTPVRLSSRIVQGENIWLYGYPQRIPVIGQGSVLGYADGGRTLRLGAFCSGGSSGGPVVNARGELIGLNFATYEYQDSCLAIPVTLIEPYLRG